MYRKKETKDLIFEFIKEKLALYKERDHWKSKFEASQN